MRLSLAKTLCNDPFNKPLHPPEPSALPPSSPTFGEGKGEALYRIYVALKPLSVRPAVIQLSPLNFVGKGSDAKPPQTGFARQLPL